MGGSFMNKEVLKKNFEAHRFQTQFFQTKEDAAEYLKSEIHGKTVGFGGSITAKEMGLYDLLKEDNTVYWHWQEPGRETLLKAMTADVYILSANGVSETGELVNIDGTGNRVAASIFGPKKVYYVVGSNKIAPDLPAAMQRAKDIASAKNAVRLNRNTPCVANGGDKCYNCNSPERICNATVIIERPCGGTETVILFVDEELGY